LEAEVMSYYENWLQAGGQPQPAVRSGNSVARDPVAPTAPKSKKGSGNQNPLTAWISELSSLGGAGAGAAIGTAILPGVGTLIGGGLGAGIAGFEGKLAENRIRDNQYDVGSAAREGGVDALFGAGPLKLGKLGASAAKSAVTSRALPEALMAAQDTVAGRVGGQAAAQRSAQGFGVKVGGGTGQNVVTPDKADAVTQFIKTGAQKYGGIKPGAPINQARDAQAVHNKVISALVPPWKTLTVHCNQVATSQARPKSSVARTATYIRFSTLTIRLRPSSRPILL
jgi:hypothetical protein